ncbi:MAG: HPF/RaiA family ribosome-associated protein [Pedobacter sp.]|nr:HPF/RaiA family ribosome-associated protein [Pedobacter sp.]MDQ8051577.1 HPF/RaiA family ribosome-associated protein [Pedobacter sp.]
MLIQLNTDKNLTIHSEYQAQIEEKINTSLQRFAAHISRIEVHLSDENGSRNGQEDKRCLLEVRMDGRSPIAVSNIGQTYDLALNGALNKAVHALDSVVGKLQDRI